MNRFHPLPTGIAPALLAVCALALAAPLAPAQQSGDIFPVASALGAPVAADTPATASETTNVENPPSAAAPDPNAPVQTEILASKGADFASKERIAIFRGDVRVNDPRFQLACDELTVFLAKTSTEGGTAAPGGTPAPRAAGRTPSATDVTDRNNPGGGIDHAVARGHVIIIQKRAATKPGEEPKVSIGRADWAEFDNKTGDMVLHGTPSVEQNANTLMALASTTIITLHKDNSMNAQGPTRTVITSHGGSSGFDVPGSAPAGNTPAKPGGKKPKKASGGA